MKTESEGLQGLKTFIRQLGAPFSLRNDNSKMQTGTACMDVCNFYNIGTETTEPHHPEQNPAENRIGTLKTVTNRLMDRTDAPDWLWLRASCFYLCGHASQSDCPPPTWALRQIFHLFYNLSSMNQFIILMNLILASPLLRKTRQVAGTH